jgi:hypothetical protein
MSNAKYDGWMIEWMCEWICMYEYVAYQCMVLAM